MAVQRPKPQRPAGDLYLIHGIKGFLPVSMLDWEGKLCAVIFMGGCSFRCPFCHNPDLVLDPEAFEDISWDEVAEHLENKRGWLDGVTVTGGEPTLHADLPRLLDLIHARALGVKLDTNGYQPEPLQELLEADLVDFVAMDVKASAEGYARATGRLVDLGRLNRSIRAIIDSGLPHEFRCTVVPGLVELPDLLHIAAWIDGAARLTLQQYNPAETLDPALQEVPALPDETLHAWAEACSQIVPTAVRGAGAYAPPGAQRI